MVEPQSVTWVARSYTDDIADKFSAMAGWYGGGWGQIVADIPKATPILVHLDTDSFDVKCLGRAYEFGHGELCFEDGTTFERDRCALIRLKENERMWRKGSVHANRIIDAIDCFDERIELAYYCDVPTTLASPAQGFIPGARGARGPRGDAQRAIKTDSFVVDYIGRVGGECESSSVNLTPHSALGEYHAVCKAVEGDDVFVWLDVKVAKKNLVARPEKKRQRVDEPVSSVSMPAAIDLDFMIQALDQGLINDGQAGMLELCQLYTRAQYVRSQASRIAELIQEQDRLLKIQKVNREARKFDPAVTKKVSEVEEELMQLMQTAEATSLQLIEAPSPSVERGGPQFLQGHLASVNPESYL